MAAQRQTGKRVFDYEEYRSFLKDSITRKKGTSAELAKFMNVSPSLVSSVLKSDRDFTSEQAIAAGEFLGLNDLELEFFLVLVELARASTERTKNFLARRVKALRQDAWREAVMGADTRTLSVDEKYVFYSDWTYSAIRMLTTIPKFRQPAELAKHLGIPKSNVMAVLEFLVKIGFCGRDGDLFYSTDTSPDIKRADPVTKKHLQNCRQVAASHLHKTSSLRDDELVFSVVASYSRENALKIKEKLYNRIKDLLVESKQGKAEVVYYLNVDFFPL